MSLSVSPVNGADILLCNGFEIAITYCNGICYTVRRKHKELLTFTNLQVAVAWCED